MPPLTDTASTRLRESQHAPELSDRTRICCHESESVRPRRRPAGRHDTPHPAPAPTPTPAPLTRASSPLRRARKSKNRAIGEENTERTAHAHDLISRPHSPVPPLTRAPTNPCHHSCPCHHPALCNVREESKNRRIAHGRHAHIRGGCNTVSPTRTLQQSSNPTRALLVRTLSSRLLQIEAPVQEAAIAVHVHVRREEGELSADHETAVRLV